jgi:hypothetical protein
LRRRSKLLISAVTECVSVLCDPEAPIVADLAYQHTVANPVRFSGIGVHTGVQARVAVLPAPLPPTDA